MRLLMTTLTRLNDDQFHRVITKALEHPEEIEIESLEEQLENQRYVDNLVIDKMSS